MLNHYSFALHHYVLFVLVVRGKGIWELEFHLTVKLLNVTIAEATADK